MSRPSREMPPPLEALLTNSPVAGRAHTTATSGEKPPERRGRLGEAVSGPDQDAMGAVVNKLTETVEQQRARIRELVVGLEKKETATQELKGLFEQLTRDYDEVASKAQGSSLALASLQAHTAAVEEELEFSKATVAMQKEKIQHFNDEWAAKTDHLRRQFAMVVEEKTAAETQRDELLENHRVLRRESERLHRELEALRASFDSRLAKDVEAATATLRQTYAEKEARLHAREEELEREAQRIDEGMYRISRENTASRESRDTLQWRLAELEKVVRAKTQMNEQLMAGMETMRDERADADRAARAQADLYEKRLRDLAESHQTQLSVLQRLIEQLKQEKVQTERTTRLAREGLEKQLEDAQERHRAAQEAGERREEERRRTEGQLRETLDTTKTKLSIAETELRRLGRLSEDHDDAQTRAQEVEHTLRHALTNAERQITALQGKISVLLLRLDEKEKETETYRCTLERGMWVRALEWAEQTGQALLVTDDAPAANAHRGPHRKEDALRLLAPSPRVQPGEMAAATRTYTAAATEATEVAVAASTRTPKRRARVDADEPPTPWSPPAASVAATHRSRKGVAPELPREGISVLSIHRGTDTGLETVSSNCEEVVDEEELLDVFFDDDVLVRCAAREATQASVPWRRAPLSRAVGYASPAQPSRQQQQTPPRQASSSAQRGGLAASLGRSRQGTAITSPSPFTRRHTTPVRVSSSLTPIAASASPRLAFSWSSQQHQHQPQPQEQQEQAAHSRHPLNVVAATSPSALGFSPSSALHTPWSPLMPPPPPHVTETEDSGGEAGGAAARQRVASSHPPIPLPPRGDTSASKDSVAHSRPPPPQQVTQPAPTGPHAELASSFGDVENSLGSARYYEEEDSRHGRHDHHDHRPRDEIAETHSDRHVAPGYPDPHALIRATIEEMVLWRTRQEIPPHPTSPHESREAGQAAYPLAGRLFVSATNTSLATTARDGSEGGVGGQPTASLVSGFVPPPQLPVRPLPTPSHFAAAATATHDTASQTDASLSVGDISLPQSIPPPPARSRHTSVRTPSLPRSETPLSDTLREQEPHHTDRAVSHRVEAALAAVRPMVRALQSSLKTSDHIVHSTLDQLVERQKQLMATVRGVERGGQGEVAEVTHGRHSARRRRRAERAQTEKNTPLEPRTRDDAVAAAARAALEGLEKAEGGGRSSATWLSSLDTNDANENFFAAHAMSKRDNVRPQRAATATTTTTTATTQNTALSSDVPLSAMQTPPRHLPHTTGPDEVVGQEAGGLSPLTIDALQRHFSETVKVPIP